MLNKNQVKEMLDNIFINCGLKKLYNQLKKEDKKEKIKKEINKLTRQW